MLHFIDLAKNEIAVACQKSIEGGVIDPSLLGAALETMGYTATETPGEKHGKWVEVKKGGAVVANGFGPDTNEAFLAAIKAYLIEDSR
jgi:hypothetical protein